MRHTNRIKSLAACFILGLTISTAHAGDSPSKTQLSGSYVGKEGSGIDSDWIITFPDAAGNGGFCEDRNRHQGVGKGKSCQIADVKFDGKKYSFAVSKTETLSVKPSKNGKNLKGKITRTRRGGKTSSRKVTLTPVKTRQAALTKADAMDKAEVRRQEVARARAEAMSSLATAFSQIAAGFSGNTATTGVSAGTPNLLQQTSQNMLQAAQAQAARAEQARRDQELEAQRRAEAQAQERRRLAAAQQQFMAQEMRNAELRRTQQMRQEQQQQELRRQQEQRRHLEQQRLEQQRKQEQRRRLAEQRRQQQQRQLEQQRRQQQQQTSTRSQVSSMPPNCVSTSWGQSGPNYTIRAVNHCGQTVNVNVCANLPGRSFSSDRQSAQLRSGQSWTFTFFEPNKQGFRYNPTYCTPGTTTATNTCPASCP